MIHRRRTHNGNIPIPKINHAELVNRAFLYLNTIGCSVRFKERVTSVSENPDAIGFGGREFSVLIECKASRADFIFDKKKLFRKRPEDGMGYKRYFMAPVGMLKSSEIPKGWGLLEVYEKTPRMNRRVRTVLESEAFQERNREAEIKYLVSAIRRINISMAVFVMPKDQEEERIAKLEGALQRIDNWAKAYPLKVFPEPDFKKVAEVLKAAGLSLDAVSASNMRHVVNGIKDIAEQALKGK